MKKPINILTVVQKQNGNKQLSELIDIIKQQQANQVELQRQIDELKSAQKKTQNEVNVIKRYLSTWHSPYIYDDFHQLFIDALELGKTDMTLTFPTFIKLVYDHPENHTVCHKNKNKSIVLCHEDSQWKTKAAQDVYEKIKSVFHSIYFPLLKSELLYENKNVIKLKRNQLAFEQENFNNVKHAKKVLKIIESDFQSISKLCDIGVSGESKDDLLILQNAEYIVKTKARNFEEAFAETKKKLNDVFDDVVYDDYYSDEDRESDCEYELESDNIDSYYDESGNFKGTAAEKVAFLKWRRELINFRKNNA
jgi:hypothetical protein